MQPTRSWLTILALLALLLLPALPEAGIGGAVGAAAAAEADQIQPPVAARRPVRLSAHGIERIDDYAWLRDPNWRDVIQDPSRLAPEIAAHIAAENAYAEAALAPLSELRAKLIEEMKGRIEPNDSGVRNATAPTPIGGSSRPAPSIRRSCGRGPTAAPKCWSTAPVLAAGKSYFSFGSYRHSPTIAFTPTRWMRPARSYSLHIRDIGARRDLRDVIPEVADFTWARDSTTLFYVRLDAEHRARFVYRHRLGTNPARDQLVYEEKDLGFEASVNLTRSGRFVVITTGSSDTSETRLIDAARPESKPILIAKREPNLRYYVDDWGDRLVIRTNADGAEDFKIVTAPRRRPAAGTGAIWFLTSKAVSSLDS